MFVTHDLSVVKHISDNIMVLYLGKCVELAGFDELFENPLHPYTNALLAAIPEPDISRRGKEMKVIRGEVTIPINVKPGCRFAARCDDCMEICRERDPELIEISNGHSVACFKTAFRDQGAPPLAGFGAEPQGFA
jgi:oligopeptide/dipeptide ABC transporter ATP-binding protein